MADKVVVNNNGCGAGCLPVIAIVGVIGLAYEYWYVTIPLAALAIVGFVAYQYHQNGGWPDFAADASTDGGNTEPGEGHWEPDPRDPENTERWREGTRWTGAIRPRNPPPG